MKTNLILATSGLLFFLNSAAKADYEILHPRDSALIFRVNTETGEADACHEKSEEWIRIKEGKESLPKSNYRFVAFNYGKQTTIVRINSKTGETWRADWSKWKKIAERKAEQGGAQ